MAKEKHSWRIALTVAILSSCVIVLSIFRQAPTVSEEAPFPNLPSIESKSDNHSENIDTQSGTLRLDLGKAAAPLLVVPEMFHDKTVIVHWSLLNSGDKPFTLKSVLADCACVSVNPTRGDIPPHSKLEGTFSYHQPVMGRTRRRIEFVTNAGSRHAYVESLKVCDHYVKPAKIVCNETGCTFEVGIYELLGNNGRHRTGSATCTAIHQAPDVLAQITKSIETSKVVFGDVGYELTKHRFTLHPKEDAAIGSHSTPIDIVVTDPEGVFRHKRLGSIKISRGFSVLPPAAAFGLYSPNANRQPKRLVHIEAPKSFRFNRLLSKPNSPFFVSIARGDVGDRSILVACCIRDDFAVGNSSNLLNDVYWAEFKSDTGKKHRVPIRCMATLLPE